MLGEMNVSACTFNATTLWVLNKQQDLSISCSQSCSLRASSFVTKSKAKMISIVTNVEIKQQEENRKRAKFW